MIPSYSYVYILLFPVLEDKKSYMILGSLDYIHDTVKARHAKARLEKSIEDNSLQDEGLQF